MNENLTWEEIASGGLKNFRTHRMRVDGGYIYRYIHNDEAHVIFVPDAPVSESMTANNDLSLLQRIKTIEDFIGQNYNKDKQDFLNAMGDLSMRLNMMQSSLREFEKQKVEPIKERMTQFMDNHDERIEKLENIGRQPAPWAIDSNVCELQRRIEKLEEENKMRIDTIACIDRAYNAACLDLEKKVAELNKYISDCDKGRFDADELLREGIEKLEQLAHKHLPANQWREEEIEPLIKIKVTAEHIAPKCNHEWDYSQILTSNPPRYRCKKCGDFSKPIDFSGVTL